MHEIDRFRRQVTGNGFLFDTGELALFFSLHIRCTWMPASSEMSTSDATIFSTLLVHQCYFSTLYLLAISYRALQTFVLTIP